MLVGTSSVQPSTASRAVPVAAPLPASPNIASSLAAPTTTGAASPLQSTPGAVLSLQSIPGAVSPLQSIPGAVSPLQAAPNVVPACLCACHTVTPSGAFYAVTRGRRIGVFNSWFVLSLLVGLNG